MGSCQIFAYSTTANGQTGGCPCSSESKIGRCGRCDDRSSVSRDERLPDELESLRMGALTVAIMTEEEGLPKEGEGHGVGYCCRRKSR